jgi:hypothetical protein
LFDIACIRGLDVRFSGRENPGTIGQKIFSADPQAIDKTRSSGSRLIDRVLSVRQSVSPRRGETLKTRR